MRLNNFHDPRKTVESNQGHERIIKWKMERKPEKMNERQVHLFGTPPSSKDGLGVPKASLNSKGSKKKCQTSFISI